MKVAIIGTHGVGKSTLFRLLTHTEHEKPHHLVSGVGMATIEDPRFENLIQLLTPKRSVKTQVEIHDFDGLGKMYKEERVEEILQHLVGFDALLQVIGDFSDFDPVKDFAEINLRIVFTDYSHISNRLDRLTKEKQKRKIDPDEEHLLNKLKETLASEAPLTTLTFSHKEESILKTYGLIALNPRLVVINQAEDKKEVPKVITNQSFVAFPLELEEEICKLEEKERTDILREFGREELISPQVLFELLGVMKFITFFTTVHDELRAWPIKSGSTAYEAAARIHTDIAHGFIKVEVVSLKDLLALGSLEKVKSQGRFHLEGKDYVVQDGDILYIRFSK